MTQLKSQTVNADRLAQQKEVAEAQPPVKPVNCTLQFIEHQHATGMSCICINIDAKMSTKLFSNASTQQVEYLQHSCMLLLSYQLAFQSAALSHQLACLSCHLQHTSRCLSLDAIQWCMQWMHVRCFLLHTAGEAVTHHKRLINLASLIYAPEKTHNCKDETLTFHGLLHMFVCTTLDSQARQVQRYIVDSNDDTSQRKCWKA